MSDLPIPLSRIDLYLAVAAGMTGVTMPEKPLSRLEQFLAYIAGDTSVTLPTPLSLTELWLAYVAGVQPKTDEMKLEGAYYIGGQKVDVRYFAVAGGMEGVSAPAPQNRTEEYWARIAEIRPIHGVLKYATGTSIALTDVVSGIEELQYVYGDTSQQTYSGKNLLNVNLASTTYYGVTITVNPDKSITLNGTYDGSTAGYVRIASNFELAAGTYTLSNGNDMVSESSAIFYDDGRNFGVTPHSNVFTSTFESAVTVKPYIKIAVGSVFNNFTIYPMIVSGIDVGNYEPYVGGIPAPNPDYPQAVNVVTGRQTINVDGLNKFDPELLSQTEGYNTYNNTTGLWTTNNSGAYAKSVFYDAAGFDSDRDVTKLLPLKPNQAYTLKLYDLSSTFTGNIVNIRFYNSLGVAVGSNISNATGFFSFITPSDCEYLDIRRFNNSGTFSFSKIMITEGTYTEQTFPNFEPYQSQSYNVDLTGDNLFNRANANENYLLKYTDGTLNSYANSIVSPFIPTSGGMVCQSNFKGYICMYDSNKGYLGMLQSGGTTISKLTSGVQFSNFTVPSGLGIAYMRIAWRGSSDGNPVDMNIQDIMLNTGAALLPYEPFYDYELCKLGDHQDYIYKSGDDWYVHKETAKITLVASQFTQVVPVGNYMHAVVQPIPGKIAKGQVGAKCNMANFVTSGSTAVPGQFYENIPNFVFVGKSTDTLDTFKTTYAGALLYYVLATASDTQITDATLISQLNAIGSAVLPKPIAYINVGATGTNLPGPLKISYYGEEE